MAIINIAGIEDIGPIKTSENGITIVAEGGMGKSPMIETLLKHFSKKELKEITKDSQYTKVNSDGLYVACEDPQVIAQRNYRKRQQIAETQRNAVIKKNHKKKNKKRMIKNSKKRNRK